jgi:pSer/pThr/pTyr-binding forkhead associated (FHA) protein
MPVRLLLKSKAVTGDRPPQQMVLSEDAIIVGRDKACNVVLNESVVSRRHCSIVREGALYFLEDLGSSFGTRVNGAPLPAGEKRLLRNGDVIAIGPFDLTFDRIADASQSKDEKTSFVAKRVVKDALRNLSAGDGPQLRVMNGPLEGKRFEIHVAQELIIGREPGVDVLLERDDLVSRRHARVRRDWTGVHIEDLGSRNGLRVNRKRVESQALKDRDEIEIGSIRFLYLDPSEVREAAIPPEEPIVPDAAERKAPRAEAHSSAAAAGPAAKPARDEPPPEPEPPAGEEPESSEPAEKEAAEEPPPASEPEPEGSEPQETSEEEQRGQNEEEQGEEEVEPAEQAVERAAERPSDQQEGWKSKLDREWRSLLPLLVVVGLAVFAIVILAITFFVM